MTDTINELAEGLLEAFKASEEEQKKNYTFPEASRRLRVRADIADRLIALGDAIEPKDLETVRDSLSKTFKKVTEWETKGDYSFTTDVLEAQVKIADSLIALESALTSRETPTEVPVPKKRLVTREVGSDSFGNQG